jgi:hypothetical protein
MIEYVKIAPDNTAVSLLKFKYLTKEADNYL